jgi:Skp family chaperone for outer membrane proteins
VLWVLSILPLDQLAVMATAIIAISWLVTWMTKKASKFLLFVALPMGAFVLLMSAHQATPPPPEIQYVTKTVQVPVKDDSQTRHFQELLGQSDQLLKTANANLAAARAAKDVAEARLAKLQSEADKENAILAAEEAKRQKLLAQKERERRAKQANREKFDAASRVLDAQIAAELNYELNRDAEHIREMERSFIKPLPGIVNPPLRQAPR